jgi:hypothetical protein
MRLRLGPVGAAGLAALLLAAHAGAAAVEAGEAAGEEDDDQLREVFVPHPEFHPYGPRDQLAVEQVTLIRVRRADQSEAIVARDASGWEQVVLDGWRLTFYNQAKQPLGPGPGRHVIVQDWSGGAHCCFDYRVLHVEGTEVRPAGTIRAGDCSLRVADLDQDGTLELIACDSRFAYAFDLPFAESPLLPMVYALRDRAYAPDNRRFPQVYRFRVGQERRRLAEAARARDARAARRAVISILLHTLYAGRVTEAWCGFERAYRWADRDTVRGEVVSRLRHPAEPQEDRIPPVDLAYALAPPGPCR